MDSTSDMTAVIRSTEDIPIQTNAEKTLQRREIALDNAVGGETGTARRKMYERLAEGLNAKKRVIDIVDGVQDIRDEPDLVMRHKYLETGLKVLGDLVEVKTEVNVDASQRTLQITTAEREELENLRKAVHGGG